MESKLLPMLKLQKFKAQEKLKVFLLTAKTFQLMSSSSPLELNLLLILSVVLTEWKEGLKLMFSSKPTNLMSTQLETLPPIPSGTQAIPQELSITTRLSIKVQLLP